MIETFIHRNKTGDDGTVGVFSIPELDFVCYVLELPWRDNKNSLSCIKPGRYLCKPFYSKKFGNVFILTDVDGRSYILIHTGNWAGDVLKKYLTNSQGCLLLGDKVFVSKPGEKEQIGVFNSRNTVRRFKSLIGNNEFYLTIL